MNGKTPTKTLDTIDFFVQEFLFVPRLTGKHRETTLPFALTLRNERWFLLGRCTFGPWCCMSVWVGFRWVFGWGTVTIQDRTQLNCQRAVSDTTSTSESDVGEDFSPRFGKSFLLGSRTSPPKRESIFKKTESMNLLSFVFVNGSVIIFTIHWHVGYYHKLLWCIRRLFFHEISTTLCLSDSPTFSWTRSCLKTDFPTPWSQWSWCCKLRKVFVWWTSNPYMFQEIYIPRFLSNSCGMLGDEYISRQTV